ncbi:hypothetical protein [Sphingomonas sp.]|uniref:hypothetical protein n=1 Tax=Sphingomonas sp. TaxID=28214 RepID=UPI00178DE927|nr:hypothetical protein [Sphingomonas sp.]MBA3510551.1 hypothetical protein [Sphingomonas sp.]
MERASDDNPVEWAADIAAATAFAASVGFAAGAAGVDAAATIAAAVGASLMAVAVLRSVSAGNLVHDLPAFEPVPLEIGQEAADELVLDDRLGSVAPDARVVRLFDPSLEAGPVARPASSNADASQALADALAELRRSLR